MTTLTRRAVEPLGVKPRDAERSKNFFALGLVSWMYTRPVDETLRWIEAKSSNKPQVRDANVAAFKAGHAFGETAELFDTVFVSGGRGLSGSKPWIRAALSNLSNGEVVHAVRSCSFVVGGQR